MKQKQKQEPVKQEPVKKEFWEKLLNLDMSVTPSSTLNLEQSQRASSSEFNSDEAAIPNANPAESKIGDAVIGVSVEDTSQTCPSQNAKSDLLQSVNSKTPPIQHSNGTQPIAEEQDLPKIATKTKGLILIPNIDLGEILSERPTSASVTKLAHSEPPPSKVSNSTPLSTKKGSDAIDNEYFETIPFERIDAGPIALPESNNYRQTIVNPSKKI